MQHTCRSSAVSWGSSGSYERRLDGAQEGAEAPTCAAPERGLVGALTALHRSLDQELVALLRGASLECLVCGEFVMHARGGNVFCPECGSQLGDENALEDGVPLTVQAG